MEGKTNLTNGNVTNVNEDEVINGGVMPEMETHTPEMPTMGMPNMTVPMQVDLNKTIYGTKNYQMVQANKGYLHERLEEYRANNPTIVANIEKYVAAFDYKNIDNIRSFGAGVNGDSSIEQLSKYVKNKVNTDVCEDVRAMLVSFMSDMEPKPVKRSLVEIIGNVISKGKQKRSLRELSQAEVDELINTMNERVDKNITSVAVVNRANIDDFLEKEQDRAIYANMFVIAGGMILDMMEKEYLLPLKSAYESDPKSVEKKIAFKEAEDKVIRFLARLNNVISKSVVTQINIDAALKEKEANTLVEEFLLSVKENTIPVLAQQVSLAILDEGNRIPMEEAAKVQQLTEKMLIENAKRVGDLYVETLETFGKPFISVDALETVSTICKEAAAKVEEIKSQQLATLHESHERLQNINSGLLVHTNELAYQLLSEEELEAFKKKAESFVPKA